MVAESGRLAVEAHAIAYKVNIRSLLVRDDLDPTLDLLPS